jgi:hypothetical protein
MAASGATADTKDPSGWTPLLKAAMLGHTAVVEALLAGNAAIEQVAWDSLATLRACCMRGCYCLQTAPRTLQTALLLAASAGQEKVGAAIQILSRQGLGMATSRALMAVSLASEVTMGSPGAAIPALWSSPLLLVWRRQFSSCSTATQAPRARAKTAGLL